MLQNLHVKNLALIDEVEITFDEHLNILTGETGAGKSVLIGSIESALGKKISKDMIRPGAKEAVIELLFWIEDRASDGLVFLSFFLCLALVMRIRLVADFYKKLYIYIYKKKREYYDPTKNKYEIKNL